MLYRRSSPRPTTLLLRIVTTTGALLGGLSACSSDSGLAPGTVGPVDSGVTADTGRTGPCGGGPCGVVAMPQDAGDGGSIVVGSIGFPGPDAEGPDAEGLEAGLPCGTGICGVAPLPQDAGEGGATLEAAVTPDRSDAGLLCGTGVCGSAIMPHDASTHDR